MRLSTSAGYEVDQVPSNVSDADCCGNRAVRSAASASVPGTCRSEAVALPGGALCLSTLLSKSPAGGQRLMCEAEASWEDDIEEPTGTVLVVEVSPVSLFLSFWDGEAAVASAEYEIEILVNDFGVARVQECLARDLNPNPAAANCISMIVPAQHLSIPLQPAPGGRTTVAVTASARCRAADVIERDALAHYVVTAKVVALAEASSNADGER